MFWSNPTVGYQWYQPDNSRISGPFVHRISWVVTPRLCPIWSFFSSEQVIGRLKTDLSEHISSWLKHLPGLKQLTLIRIPFWAKCRLEASRVPEVPDDAPALISFVARVRMRSVADGTASATRRTQPHAVSRAKHSFRKKFSSNTNINFSILSPWLPLLA